ncbi:MAG TPA: amidohydrolase family protein [Dehalococcoidia bacterium]|nr:amidohydrolase family protein [Dehalococcoidia bacterium]
MGALLLTDATLIDGTGIDPRPHMSVLIEGGRITRVADAGTVARDEAKVIDCSGLWLLPGLTDAHVHFGLTAAGDDEPPGSHVSYVLKVVENIRIALDEGFTTVRDAGGLDPAYALAVAAGEIAGPRILPSGSFLSQTGGHGDHRSRWSDAAPASIAGLVAHTEICDGVDEVRRAARTQLRRGATQIKVMASGGVMSPNDPLESLQFTVDEMAAAVHEARAFGTYVLAHCHTPGAIANALDAGVRSIEHGSMLNETLARRMAQQEAYLVPTLVILELLAREEGLPEFSRRKLELVRGETRGSLELARAAGVPIGSGSDLLGPRQSRRAAELVEKAKDFEPMAAIVSATRTNALLFNMADRIGTVEAGKDADVIAVAGDPLSEIGVLADADNVRLVVQRGQVAKNLL